MPRKKKTKKNTGDLVNMEATVRKLQSELTDPRVQTWLWKGAQGVRERILELNFHTLRRLSVQLPLISGIINTRHDQIRPYCKYAIEDGDKGFRFEIENKTRDFENAEPNEKEMLQLATFIEQTGFLYDPDREDDFADYVGMIIRDTYEIDQVATELQKNRKGEPIAFWGVDGATIARVADENDFAKGVRFVQMVDEKVLAKYTNEEMVFDYMYKRSDIRYRGYGYSPVEQCINIITTLLFGYNYIRDQLVRDRVPKGFISVMGDVGAGQLDSIRNYWYSAMSGAGANWNIPILPSGKDGVGMDFKTLGSNNKDMEYHKTMMFVSSMVAAVFSIDLTELGIKADDSTTLIGESSEPRIQSSKDRGLASMLAYIEQHMNKILRKVTQKYRFKFVGLEQEDKSKEADIRAKQIANWRSIDEVREEDGLDPFGEEWSKMPMNVQAVQMVGAAKQAEQQEAMQQQGYGGAEGGGEEDDIGDYEDSGGGYNAADQFADMGKALPTPKQFKQLTDRKERTVRIVIE